MGGEPAILFTMSKIERVRRIGGSDVDMANLRDITIGTNGELIKSPFGGEGHSAF